MNASPVRDVLSAAEAEGVTLTAHGEMLRLTPKGRASGALRAQIKRYKPQLVEELRGPKESLADISGECVCGASPATYYEPRPMDGVTPLCGTHAPTRYEGMGVSLPKRDMIQYYLGAPCDTCGSDRRWQSDDGKQHCLACEAPPAQYAVPAASAQPQLPERKAAA